MGGDFAGNQAHGPGLKAASKCTVWKWNYARRGLAYYSKSSI